MPSVDPFAALTELTTIDEIEHPEPLRVNPRIQQDQCERLAVLRKELVQLRRDRLTFAMLIGVPIMQLVLFGYAINGDPRQLPTALVALDDGPLVRSIVRAAENTAAISRPMPSDHPVTSGKVCEAGITGSYVSPSLSSL